MQFLVLLRRQHLDELRARIVEQLAQSRIADLLDAQGVAAFNASSDSQIGTRATYRIARRSGSASRARTPAAHTEQRAGGWRIAAPGGYTGSACVGAQS
jgi:hypothetical protein